MNQIKSNNIIDDDWGFYIDIDIENDNQLANNYSTKKTDDDVGRDKKDIKTVISDDLSYCIDMYNFNEYLYEDSSYETLYDNSNISDISNNDYNLYNNICYTLKYYKNSFDTKKFTNMLIKVSSTTFATIAVSCVILSIL